MTMQLFVVEDQAIIALELQSLLQELGHEVVALAGNLDDALQLAEEVDAVDAALLDLDLGGRSSLPVARLLQDRGIPCLLCTGHAPEDYQRMGFDAPCIEKPYRGRDLKRALDALH